jgi:hypothetical protein
LTQKFALEILIRALELTQILGQPCEFQVTGASAGSAGGNHGPRGHFPAGRSFSSRVMGRKIISVLVALVYMDRPLWKRAACKKMT